jgi:nucleotide-binding universal stress UspA family protein
MIQAIAHPTDFTPEGEAAFLHSLRLAIAHRCRLDLLHVRTPSADDSFDSFPHVREPLIRWGMLGAGATVEDIHSTLGVKVHKVEIRHHDTVAGLVNFMIEHRPDVLVMATHGRQGLNRWLLGSVSEDMAQHSHLPTLLIGPEATPFVDAATGALSLNNILVPVTLKPPPGRAMLMLDHLTAGLGAARHFVHVGNEDLTLLDPDGVSLPVERRDGPVVDALLHEARSKDVDLIAMATAGHDGFLDVLRGNTTEQVLRQAPCPVLALPA